LTAGQATYRLRKASVKRSDYRSGTRPEAPVILRTVYGNVQRSVKKRLTGQEELKRA